MKIAPIDIAHKTFARKVMGLDADEVGDFLRDIADQMEELVRERNSLKETLRQKDLQIMEYRERDESLKQTIQTATKMSESIRVDAEREAKLIINDAQQKAEMILRDSRDSLKKVYQEIAELKRTRMQFEVNLRSVCHAHLSMLDQSHMAMPDPQINLAHAAASVGNMPTPGTAAGAMSFGGGGGIATAAAGGAGSHAHSHGQPQPGALAGGGISGGSMSGGSMSGGATVTHVNMPTPGYSSGAFTGGRAAGPIGKA